MYNSALYNEPNYNSTHFSLDAFESLSSTDQEDMLGSIVKSDILTVSDALSKLLNNNPFLDATVITDDDIANMLIKVFADSSTLSDSLKLLSLKVLSETVTISELRAMLLNRHLGDSTVLVDNLTKQIVDKSLRDTIRLKDWFMIKHKPQHGEWYD